MSNQTSYSLAGKTVLVTGGTGSFGKAFVKRILASENPKEVVVFSRDELKQFEMANEVNSPLVKYKIGDVRDADRLRRVMSGCDVVVHAAALKQIPAAEFNPIECIRTNVMGAENVINAAIDNGVDRVVALSTDKAANPMNLYGATKLCSDKLFIAANQLVENGTVMAVVRYGNVIGSRGSVIPFFKQRAKQGVLPITDERMTRFWITLDQGVDMVLKSLDMMKGGEIFVPKLPSMQIMDLAKAICPDCRHEIIGIRPGERLHEIMVPTDEQSNALEFDDFFVIQPSFHWGDDTRTNVYKGEEGRPVPKDFQYVSNVNDHWMSIEDLQAIIDDQES